MSVVHESKRNCADVSTFNKAQMHKSIVIKSKRFLQKFRIKYSLILRDIDLTKYGTIYVAIKQNVLLKIQTQSD